MTKRAPIVVMGHLFAAGGQTVEGDGVRDLYIGSLAQVRADVFPESVDYVALGHLHIPQTVGGSEYIRYSGSPLPIGFGEAGQGKSMVLLEFSENQTRIQTIPVPAFQKMKTLRGNLQAIEQEINVLKSGGSHAWVEVVYDGDELAGDLRGKLEEAVDGTEIEILCVKNSRVLGRVMGMASTDETLDDLDVSDVFQRCLDRHGVSEEQRPGLLSAYREIVTSLHEADPNAK